MKHNQTLKTYLSFYAVTLIACVVDYIGGFIDNAVGGRMLGEEVFSALSVVGPLSVLFSMVGNCLVGGSILASQALGAGEMEKAKAFYRKTVLLTVAAGIGITALSIGLSECVCRFLCKNASEDVIRNAREYLIWYSPSAIPFLLIFVLTGFTRLDDAKNIPMISTIVVMISDVALDFLLTPVFGVRGLAAATSISYLMGLMTYALYFVRKNRVFTLKVTSAERVSTGRMLATGAPVAMNRLGNFINSILLNYLVFTLASTTGGVVINARNQCMVIVLAVLMGTIQAGVPALGEFYGAKNRRGHHEMARLVLLSSLIHAAVLTLVCVLLYPAILNMFGVAKTSEAYLPSAFAIICLGGDLILKAVITSTVVIYQTTGREKRANLLSAMETVLLLIPLELVFGLTIGINGLFIGALTADAILVAFILIMQRRNRDAAIFELPEANR